MLSMPLEGLRKGFADGLRAGRAMGDRGKANGGGARRSKEKSRGWAKANENIMTLIIYYIILYHII